MRLVLETFGNVCADINVSPVYIVYGIITFFAPPGPGCIKIFVLLKIIPIANNRFQDHLSASSGFLMRSHDSPTLCAFVVLFKRAAQSHAKFVSSHCSLC